METLWLIPVHVRPVVSYEGLTKGVVRDPSSGLDRFNLTDVGEVFYGTFRSRGGEVKFKNIDLPFPWEMVFKFKGEPKASLRGIKVGPSTYRSIFKLVHFDDPGVNEIIGECLSDLGRDPIDSPYWDDANWQLLQKQLRISRNTIVSTNGSFSP